MQDKSSLDVAAWRLANADFSYGLNPDMTAYSLELTPKMASRLRSRVAYKARIEELKAEWMRRVSGQMGDEIERLRASISSLVPQAIEVLRNSLSDPETSLRAAQEILDRDGRLPKVSRLQQESREQAVLPEVSKEIAAEFHKVN
jgi:hypothetical protein